jgi:hypothetical protein
METPQDFKDRSSLIAYRRRNKNENIDVLAYTNANGPATDGWAPRVRKIGKDGKDHRACPSLFKNR